jgi:hypothetical protein
MTMMIRAAPYIAAIAIFVGVFWWVVESSYEHGRKIERLEWMEYDEAQKRQADIRIAQIEYKLKTERDKADTRATQIIGAYANEIEKLHTDLADATDHRLYISAKKPICEADRNAMPSSNESPSKPTPEIRFEIPAPLGRAIRGDYFTAAGLEMRYNMLVELIESRPDCFEVVR